MRHLDSISRNFDPSKEESVIYERWMKAKAFHPDASSDKPPFTIVMPPPNITGELHMGHAMDNTLMDILTRFQRMRGKNTLFLPGSDHASIATEALVTARLRDEGFSKEEIGRDAFLKYAWQWKKMYEARIISQQKRLGLSCDWDRHRFTMDDGLTRAVVRVFNNLYKEGLIYRGKRMINWCPHCNTSISDIEVEHEDIEGGLYTIRYPLASGEGSISIATTRPETMLADTAVAVHPDDVRGKAYIGQMVRLPLTDREIPVIADDYVDPEFGTGFLKITPAHDPNDYELGLRHSLPVIEILTDRGLMTEDTGRYAGMTVLDARRAVVEDLKRQGLLEKEEKRRHNVGTCQRCHTLVEPRVSTQWFVKMKPLAEPAIEVVKCGEVRFNPDHFKKIYFNWMENIRDWCISRQLWWGHRIPAWYCDDCGEVIVAEETPSICTACGSTALRQDEDTLDTWFSSALWPFSTLGWPEDTDDYRAFYPTDVLVTGYDIIFFWVARMIFSAIHNTGNIPFHTVLIHGLVRDEQGRKMSKSLGNGIDPLEVIDDYGADTLRYALVVGNAPGNDLRLSEEKLENGRNFINKIWNAFRFTLMNLDENLDFSDVNEEDFTIEDRWIMSELRDTIDAVTSNMEALELGLAQDKIYKFLWDLFCDWYIELVKERLREGGKSGRAAQSVLYRVLSDTMKLLHPFMPFVTEKIYDIFHDNTLLISEPWPDINTYAEDQEAETAMQSMMDAIRGVRNLRATYNVTPQQRFSAWIRTEDDAIACRMEEGARTLERLAGVSSLSRLNPRETLPKDAVSFAFQGGEMAVPLRELIDIDEERARLAESEDRLRKEIDRAAKMLANRQFTEKAPARVVETQREKKEQYEQQLRTVLEQQKRLSAL
ncbi:MAG: valine--tRNA ligase [Clostridiaceae bacterium]|jgi:valyl-tRNA synthetase|nr:valine--tRNA ligase [Clostridiaceae bacterium]